MYSFKCYQVCIHRLRYLNKLKHYFTFVISLLLHLNLNVDGNIVTVVDTL